MLKIKIIKENRTPDRVHAKARYLQDKEGYKKDQAYAIAHSMDKKGDLDEEQLDEISAMAGGAVAGGVAFGDEADIKSFNDKEKKISKLKNNNLEEKYSTAAMPAQRSPKGFEKEVNDGRIERSRMQGLQNVKESKLTFHDKWKQFKILLENESTEEEESSTEALIRFATNARNQRHLKSIINQIFEEYKFEQLWKATVTDDSAEERIEFMSINLPDVIPNMSKEISKGNETAIRDYYYFLATEYLYWTLTNPRAHPGRKGVGIFEMTDEIRNYVMAHIDRYAHPRYGKSSKNNPKSLSQSTIGPDSPSQKDYGEKGGLNPLLFKLPE
jgi:hypothetical protein